MHLHFLSVIIRPKSLIILVKFLLLLQRQVIQLKGYIHSEIFTWDAFSCMRQAHKFICTHFFMSLKRL